MKPFASVSMLSALLVTLPVCGDESTPARKANAPAVKRPIVIAHRGASGYRPEHTIAAYEVAIEQGADFIEPDLVLTADGVLIARHDNLLNLTTNVAEVAKHDDAIASLRTTKRVNGTELTGYFAEDFTLAQINKLRATERRAKDDRQPFRPANTKFDGEFEIPTFAGVIRLAKTHRVGIYPETKFPTHIAAETNVNTSALLLDVLQANGINTSDDLPIYIQSFETTNLKWLKREMLRRTMDFPLVQLLAPRGQPYDVAVRGGTLTYDQMATPDGLRAIAEYADGVGPEKYHFILPKDVNDELHLTNLSSFVRNAHTEGLIVHPYTFRAENRALPTNFRRDSAVDANFGVQIGDSVDEIDLFLRAGVDGFFTDQPDIGVKAAAAHAVVSTMK